MNRYSDNYQFTVNVPITDEDNFKIEELKKTLEPKLRIVKRARLGENSRFAYIYKNQRFINKGRYNKTINIRHEHAQRFDIYVYSK